MSVFALGRRHKSHVRTQNPRPPPQSELQGGAATEAGLPADGDAHREAAAAERGGCGLGTLSGEHTFQSRSPADQATPPGQTAANPARPRS